MRVRNNRRWESTEEEKLSAIHSCRRLVRRVAIPFVVAAVLAAPVQAEVFWSNSSGSGDFFTWENGRSDNGLYGDPVLVGGNTFVFTPTNFRAEASDDQTVIVSDRLTVDLIADPGFFISGIVISEAGDYTIVGTGSVEATGSFSLTNLDTNEVRNTDIAFVPDMPITSGSGVWTGEGEVDLSNEFPQWTRLTLTLENDLISIAGPNSTAIIAKKVVGAGVAITIIPEPATVLLLGAGVAGVLRRRRR